MESKSDDNLSIVDHTPSPCPLIPLGPLLPVHSTTDRNSPSRSLSDDEHFSDYSWRPAFLSKEDTGKPNTTELQLLITRGRREAVRAALVSGASPSAVGFSGRPPLHLAAWSNDGPICSLLLQAGADIGDLDNEGQTALQTAVLRGSVEAARVLLEAGAHVDDKCIIGGAKVGNAEIMSLLLADYPGPVPARAVCEAVIRHHAEVAVQLVKRTHNYEGSAESIDIALQNHNSQVLFEFLAARVPVSQLQRRQITEKTLCEVEFYDIESAWKLADIILDSNSDTGAVLSASKHPLSPLLTPAHMRAVANVVGGAAEAAVGQVEKLKQFLEENNDPNMKTENGMTLLHWACAGDAPECVQLLLDAGADKEACDLRGATPVVFSLHNHRLLHLFITSNLGVPVSVDLYVLGGSGTVRSLMSPICFAVLGGRHQSLQLLVGAGAVRRAEVPGYFTASPVWITAIMKTVKPEVVAILNRRECVKGCMLEPIEVLYLCDDHTLVQQKRRTDVLTGYQNKHRNSFLETVISHLGANSLAIELFFAACMSIGDTARIRQALLLHAQN